MQINSKRYEGAGRDVLLFINEHKCDLRTSRCLTPCPNEEDPKQPRRSTRLNVSSYLKGVQLFTTQHFVRVEECRIDFQ